MDVLDKIGIIPVMVRIAIGWCGNGKERLSCGVAWEL